MKTWALAAVSQFALGAVAPAGAADLPLYAKTPVAPVLVNDWSGVHVGINGGGGLAHACWGVTSALGIAVDPAVGEGCHNAGGGTIGGQIGYFATLAGGFLARTDRIGQDIDMGLIRINYRWGGPVVAKY
jgi:outer membrane immunogenic protein